jgi:hypothetical protein
MTNANQAARQLALTAFLTRDHTDHQDQLGQRAVTILNRLKTLYQTADDRGNFIAMQDCALSINMALEAFACINAVKGYAFADLIHPDMAVITRTLQQALHTAQLSENAATLVAYLNAIEQRLKPALPAVTTVRGIASVRILRGDHCTAACNGLKAENDNEPQT